MEKNNFARRFSNFERLSGKNYQHTHIVVAGLGGVGSWAAEALIRCGIGFLTLIDLDNVSESNTNRQLHALEPFYGLPKIQVLKERFLAISPDSQIFTVEDFVTFENCEQLFGQIPHKINGILDCTDDIKAKIALILFAKKNNIPFIVSGGAGGKLNPAELVLSDLSKAFNDPLLANLRNTLRRHYGFAKAGKKMKVPVVFSKEVLKRPLMCQNGHLNCAGLGSSVMVTASFGFAAAAYLLQMMQSFSIRS